MYAVFILAASPLAIDGCRELIYFLRNPEMLEVRDTFTQMYGVYLMGFAAILYLIGSCLGIINVITGPSQIRYSAIILILIWPILIYLIPQTDFRSMARLWWECLPYLFLTVIPVLLWLVAKKTT